MKRDYSISVAMATYNGEKYIGEQLESILNQLEKQDEIIISDDGSTDNTIGIIKAINDKRIKIINGPQNGVKQNFANAIKNCNGKYIFLSDQDDLWLEGKVLKVLETFKQKKCTLVIHDAYIVDTNLKIIENSFFKYRNSGAGIIKNILKNTYIGCCMAFSRNIIKYILPIPNNIEMHDQWIGILNEKYGKSYFVEQCLIKYRRHDDNVSNMSHHPITKMIRNRINFIKEFNRRKK